MLTPSSFTLVSFLISLSVILWLWWILGNLWLKLERCVIQVLLSRGLFVGWRGGGTWHSSLTISSRWKAATTLHLLRESQASGLPQKHVHIHTLSYTELLKGALLWPLCNAKREQTLAFHQCLTGRWKGHRYLLYLVSVHFESWRSSRIMYLLWNSESQPWNANYFMHATAA